MNIHDLLRSCRRVFLDTAPLIFYAERHPIYFQLVEPVFVAIDSGQVQAVTSVVTLAECLVHPYMKGLTELQQVYYDLITAGNNTLFTLQDAEMGRIAAQIRARYRVALLDALQIATALQTDCDALLTNDRDLKRVQEIHIVVVEEITI
ncbi:MAG: PIN domain-containing protein [bacterium]|nr:PIN domain-containing protein [bacterium]